MPILHVVVASAAVVLLVPALYLLLLTVVGLVFRPGRRTRTSRQPRTRFAVLVPAHNEEVLLPRLMESLRQQSYPGDLFKVYVVADNCTDSTADVVRSLGASVFERRDTTLVGKGYALRWLLEHIKRTGREYDAYLFIDADCTVSPGFLSVMDAMLQSGSRVVQCYYTVSNVGQSYVSSLRYAGLALMHYVRPLGKRVLGLSCGLFGTGMVFSREIVERFGWETFSLAEDIEYHMRLMEQGIRVDFAPGAVLWSDMPVSLSGAKGQNLRWERGRLLMAWSYVPRLLLRGIGRRDIVKMGAALELLTPPMSLTFALALLLLPLSLLALNPLIIGLALSVNAMLWGHLLLGLVLARAPLAVYRAFACAPWFILWKMWVYAQALLPRQMRWTRTERAASAQGGHGPR